MSEAATFTLRADAREGGGKTFEDDVAQLEDITFAETSFTILDLGKSTATVRAEGPEELEADEEFVQALEDALVSSHGIYLDLQIEAEA